MSQNFVIGSILFLIGSCLLLQGFCTGRMLGANSMKGRVSRHDDPAEFGIAIAMNVGLVFAGLIFLISALFYP